MDLFGIVCVILIVIGLSWVCYYIYRTAQWLNYAKARLADNFWRVLNAGDTFSDALLEQFVRDLNDVSESVLIKELSPVAYPSSDFLFQAREKLRKGLDDLTIKRHFSDRRNPRLHGELAEHLNTYTGIKVFEDTGTVASDLSYQLSRKFVEQYIMFKASGLSSVQKPIPVSPYFPLDNIPKFFWTVSLIRYRELSESED